ncbi:unnamed protein product [Mortierella alpina]
MESDTNASIAIPIQAQAQTMNAIAALMPISAGSTDSCTDQFLGLRAKLSRAFVTHTIVFVLYSAYQLYRNRESITSFTSRAKEAVVSNCYALEQSTNAVAALPRFAAEGVVHGLVTALQTTISQIGYGLDAVLNGFLAALEVMVTLLTSIWRCFLENLSNSGIPLLSEIGNGGVQAIDQINQAMLSILEKPFSELSGVIRQHMADPRVELSVYSEDMITPQIAFCAEKLDFVVVDKLGVEMRCWILYAAVALLVAAVEEPRLSQEVVSERNFPEAEQYALQIVKIVRHPLLSDFLEWFSRRLLRMKEHSAQRFIWFGYYVAHPPAVACLLIGLLGLIFTYSQLAMIDYSRLHARPILATALDDLSDVIQSLATREIQNVSKAFALSTNVALSQLESGLNDNVFGSIVKAAGELDSGLKIVQETMIQGIQAVFGEGAFSLLVLSVLQCLFFNKLAVVQSGLVWLQENANMRLPRLSESVLMPEPTELYNLITNIMGDRVPDPSSSPSLLSDRFSEGDGRYPQRGIRVTEDSVSRVLDLYESEVRKDLPVYYSLVGIWYLLLAMGLIGTKGLKTNI